MKTHLRSCVAALALAAAGAGMASAQELVIGTDVDAGTLDPRLTRDTTAYRTSNLISSGLVQLTPQLEAVPDLAESWESPDDTTVVFTLREGLTFSDGSALTAEDVVHTFETLIDPDFNAPQRSLYTPIESVEAIDERTVQFNLSTPYAPLLSYLDMGIVPSDYEGDMALEPVGAGPMVLESWTRGSEIVLAPSESYWAGAPEVEQVTMRIVGDNSARAQAFEAGDLDVIQSPLSPNDIQRLQDMDGVGSAIIAGLGVTYLNFNTSDPLLSDPEMRQAFAMLVDQDTIVNQIYQGVDEVATSVILPGSWAYSPDIQQPTFDIEGAVSKFNELGWSDSDGDGFLDKDGETLSITLSTHSEDPNRVQSVEFLQAMMQQAGVDASVQISDWPSFSTGYVQQGEHQIALLGWLNIVDPDRMLYSQLSSEGGLNWGGYDNAEVDALLEEGRTALEQDARTEAYRAAAEIIAEELPYYIISYQGYQLFWDEEAVSDVTANPRGAFRGLIGLATPE
ncbi:peptide ABC transporter, periplasmic peptide-binding protein [Oceanicola granulosus HTCC2516]|uniref:Peptide ABC transporter, periplasmic peptide-binding protein n=1 Tax=Oceanicola granulosus (strain ATCC BAA-861 / DSM 15982 / KCTC 12143 / HTCC2516) TaxID=314256 RepID=Q2CJF8_OCEGH|nr:ABC transporter substrate-binding protein [Oceanicola granulosus]EAR52642.1 peptide ABC transporter, periplasmic peptide-binding protein [Oceanicola granulosus HTCC2516]